MQSSLPICELESCPKCGVKLEEGYILGKQNRIRWSASPKGMTIFHGVPLIKLEKGFWRKYRWWVYAPNIPAKRCKKCHLAVFLYNNDQQESHKNERIVCSIAGGALIIFSLAGLFLTVLGWSLPTKLPVFAFVLLSILSLVLLLLGAILIRHVLRLYELN